MFCYSYIIQINFFVATLQKKTGIKVLCQCNCLSKYMNTYVYTKCGNKRYVRKKKNEEACIITVFNTVPTSFTSISISGISH